MEGTSNISCECEDDDSHQIICCSDDQGYAQIWQLDDTGMMIQQVRTTDNNNLELRVDYKPSTNQLVFQCSVVAPTGGESCHDCNLIQVVRHQLVPNYTCNQTWVWMEYNCFGRVTSSNCWDECRGTCTEDPSATPSSCDCPNLDTRHGAFAPIVLEPSLDVLSSGVGRLGVPNIVGVVGSLFSIVLFLC